MWLWFVAAFVAFFIKGLCGFANTLIFTSILGFGVDNVNISPVDLVLGYPTNMIMTWNYRKHLDKKLWMPLAALVLIGCIPGAVLLKNLDAHLVKIVFGVIVILIGIEMFLRESGRYTMHESRIVRLIIGLVAGAMCGMFGVGILLAAYLGRVTDTVDELKANLSAVFVVENTFRLVLYIILGVVTPASVKQAIILVPVMLIALFSGIYCSKHMNDKTIKRCVIVLLMISGIALIWKNL
jgi:hypothetical protein